MPHKHNADRRHHIPKIRLIRAASSLLGRVFAWIGGTAISLVLGLGHVALALLGELGIQLVMLILAFRGIVRFLAWACILAAAVLQYQVPSEKWQNALMLCTGAVLLGIARILAVVNYRIKQRRLLGLMGTHPGKINIPTFPTFPGSRDEPFR